MTTPTRAGETWLTRMALGALMMHACVAVAANATWLERPEVEQFVQTMVIRHGFEAEALRTLLAQSQRTDTALRLIAPKPPGRRGAWVEYRRRFVEPRRVADGLRFWATHATTLHKATHKWGVPEAVIVAIIGIETFYGRQLGQFPVLDVLVTLAFEEPRRAAYFQTELEQFLLLTRETQTDPKTARGSFAGAMGLPQFMPSSQRRYGVDFDGDGRVDLRRSPADAIGSVARFLSEHGWQTGQPTHVPAQVSDAQGAQAAAQLGIPPRLTLAQLAALGIHSETATEAAGPWALIDLPNQDAPTDYVLGAHNFWVITRYNRSYFYAMAVIEFAQALAHARGTERASVAD